MTLDLNAIKARVDKATPGPWRAELFRDHPGRGPLLYDSKDYFASAQWRIHGLSIEENDAMVAQVEADFEFLGHARQDIPALLQEIDRLNAELEQLKAGR